MEIIWRVIVAGRGKGENGGKGAGIKYKLVGTEETGDFKNSMGNRVAKELLWIINGHELREGVAGENEGTRQRGEKRKNWGNCNIINKIIVIEKEKNSIDLDLN